MHTPELSIIIPCFNEKDNVRIVLNKLNQYIQENPLHCEIILVDGGSNDHTQHILSDLFKTLDPNIFKLYLMETGGGYGHDIMYGIHNCTGTLISWTHADLQTDTDDIFKAYALYKQSVISNPKIFIKGKRKNRRFIETFFTFGMQVMTLFILGKYLDDINAQPKLFSRDFYQKHLKNGYPNDFSLDLYALYKAHDNGYSIQTFPVYFKQRLYGEAKGGGSGWKQRIHLIKRTFAYILKLRHRG